MANIIYNAGLRDLLTNLKTLDEGAYLFILERSTSTYAPDKDHTTLLNQAGWVEISVAAYARKDVAAVAITADNTNNRAIIDCGDAVFGTLESGQTVKSVIVARNDGGNLVPLLRIDTDEGGLLPRELGGGAFTVQVNAVGLITFAQV